MDQRTLGWLRSGDVMPLRRAPLRVPPSRSRSATRVPHVTLRPQVGADTFGEPMRCRILFAGSVALIFDLGCTQQAPDSRCNCEHTNPPAPASCPTDTLVKSAPQEATTAPDRVARPPPVNETTAHPTVTLVAAGGYWETAAARGRYRVVVKTHCGEHCVEEVLLEQIDESVPEGRIRRVASVPETRPGRVGRVEFWPSGKWTDEIEFVLTDDSGKERSRLCLKVGTDVRHAARTGPCPR